MPSHRPVHPCRIPLLALVVVGAVGVTGVGAGDAEPGPEFGDLDRNRDAYIDVGEASAHSGLERQYDAVDLDQDGLISEQEFLGLFPATDVQPTESWFTAPEHKPE